MKSLSALFFQMILSAGLLASLAFSPGCGGGTTGTGGTGSSEFRGYILSSTGDPISDATVIIAETGDSGVSGASGEFYIESQVETETSVTLLVDTESTTASTVIDGLPGTVADVQVDLRLDEKSGELTVTKKKVTKKKKKPTPTPVPPPPPDNTPTPIPTAAPVDTPTPLPTDIPVTDTPTPSPIPEDTPTATPTVTPSTSPSPVSAIFAGRIVSDDPLLVQGAAVRIAGYTAWKLIEPDGTFRFRAVPDPAHAAIAVKSGEKIVRANIGPITDRTTFVHVRLKIWIGPLGNLRVKIMALTIKEGAATQ